MSSFMLGREYIVSTMLGTVMMMEGWVELIVPVDLGSSSDDPPNLIRDRSRTDGPVAGMVDHRPKRPKR